MTLGIRPTADADATISSARARLDPEFASLLDPFLHQLEVDDETVVCGTWPDLRLAFLNKGWFLALKQHHPRPEESDRWGLGRNILDGIHGPLKSFFETNLRHCLEKSVPWHHRYECSSPNEFREYQMNVLPLPRQAGLLILHFLTERRPHEERRVLHHPEEQTFRDRDGFIIQCSYCRRVRKADGEPSWHWVPEWVATSPSKTSHGLCRDCLLAYFDALVDVDSPAATSVPPNNVVRGDG
ncbi:hypothetical protein Pan216_51070 [Planctomycetes bacterium Pan216]|uniref:Uncharacterized protein n=1 Tax=Kolteria novifilia TaxID=2527975 RepID=A0A518BB58_9BACT|nr:hypothetical protein Pan216_51070 [Planctomycetes bacterium Pan216]